MGFRDESSLRGKIEDSRLFDSARWLRTILASTGRGDLSVCSPQPTNLWRFFP